jgi:hypothetical protein
VDNLKVFPFLKSQDVIDNLKSELPKYLALAEDVLSIDKNDWWRRHESSLVKGMQNGFISSILCCSRKSFFSPFKQFYREANVVIGGLHRNFYNASVQQTELTLFLITPLFNPS